MSSKFIPLDRDTLYLMPPSVNDWLPQKHIARFVVEIIEQLDLSKLEKEYSPLGRKAYPVQVMLGLLFYGYITGIYSSRKIEAATTESVPFRYIAGNIHPDHDTIASFRKQFIKDLDGIFLQILMIASNMGILKMGNVATDGTKIKANASKHKALSWDYANKLEAQLKEEVEKLIQMAQDADAVIPEGMIIPEELSRREKRLEVIQEAKRELTDRAQKRFEIEQAEYEAKMADRKKDEEKTGKKKVGKVPQPPVAGPRKNDQVNLNDNESRIMPKSGNEFIQGYNAQATADVDSKLIVANHVTQNPNDKLEIAPALEQLKKTEDAIQQKCSGILGDAGFFSAENTEKCEQAGIAPYLVDKRDRHNKSLTERFENSTESVPENADAVAKMKLRLKTKEGKKLYAKRKTTIEPIFGIIKNVMNFRSFLLRGLEAVKGEWTLVAMAFNIKRMFALRA